MTTCNAPTAPPSAKSAERFIFGKRAVEELAIWIEQRGSTETSEAVHRHLDTRQANADFIGEGIVALMSDTWAILSLLISAFPLAAAVR
ncbi:hypothetical protein E8F12_14485 [Pseudomonas sp. BN102]|nr:hypothetical protein [Pseudomonas sp. BN102]